MEEKHTETLGTDYFIFILYNNLILWNSFWKLFLDY